MAMLRGFARDMVAEWWSGGGSSDGYSDDERAGRVVSVWCRDKKEGASENGIEGKSNAVSAKQFVGYAQIRRRASTSSHPELGLARELAKP